MAKYNRDTSFDNYFLLGDSYKQQDVIVNKFTGDEQWESCKKSCENCKICRDVSPFRQNCWRHCDRCKYCKFRDHRSSQKHHPPYWTRHPYTPDPDDIDFALSHRTTSKVCGPVMYAEYIKQYNDYINCKKCQQRNKCWSKYQEKCVECSDEQLAVPCEEKYGCPNPNGASYGYGPPRNPMYTSCRKCWKKQYTTLLP